MLDKLRELKNWQASLVITIFGFAAYFDGLKNQFLGDDTSQIVNNSVVHSISHIRLFFEGGTFYVGKGLAPLAGVYFRPLMTTVFSLLYTIFGAQPFYFHLFQLCLCIGSTILLYLFFRYSFKPVLALFLSLVFLVHPLDSQVVFALASMQDALFFFFGILALWLLVRINSVRSLVLVALCLLLSLFAKETAVLFVAMSLLYLLWWDRKRLYPFMGAMVLPVALWLTLKVHAIGFLGTNPHNAPIDSLSLAGRLMTAPSIALFYALKFLFPLQLAHTYYWTSPAFSVRHVLLPLVADLAVIALVVYLGLVIRRRASKATLYTYLFFAVWAGLGLVTTLQVIPVDMTASETWFYFSMAGVLGMIGTAINALDTIVHFNRRLFLVVMVVVLALLGVRTAVRGTNWSSPYVLAYHDIKVSREDYISDGIIATALVNQGNLDAAKVYASRSISIFPSGTSYETLGYIYYKLGNYSQAEQAYLDGLKLGGNPQLEESLSDDAARLMLWYGNPRANTPFIERSLVIFPHDSNLLLDLAVEQYESDNASAARSAIAQAYSYNPDSGEISSAYTIIMNNERLVLNQPQ